jgi:membrane protein
LTNSPTTERVVRASRRFVRGLEAHNAFEAAAAIAFWFFLSLMPLLVLLGYLVAQVARSRGMDALLGPVFDIVPETAEEVLRKEIDRMAGSNASLAPLGVLGFLWTASSGLHNLMDVFETGVKVERRAWWKQRAMALGWVLAGLATACLLAWLLVKVDRAMQPREATIGPGTSATAIAAVHGSASAPGVAPAPSSHAGDHLATTQGTVSRARGAFKHRLSKAIHTPVEQAIATALMLALGSALLAAFYRFAVVHPPGVRRRVWPGTVTAVVSWLVVSWFFGLYAVSMSTYAVYYGSLAAVAVMLVWLYITSLALVVGAEVNAQLEGVRGALEDG